MRHLTDLTLYLATPTPVQQRKTDFAAMVKTMKKAKPCKAPPVTYCNSNAGGSYSGADLLDPPVRVNAAQAFKLPSRVGTRLNHPCGRVTDLAGKALAAGVVL